MRRKFQYCMYLLDYQRVTPRIFCESASNAPPGRNSLPPVSVTKKMHGVGKADKCPALSSFCNIFLYYFFTIGTIRNTGRKSFSSSAILCRRIGKTGKADTATKDGEADSGSEIIQRRCHASGDYCSSFFPPSARRAGSSNSRSSSRPSPVSSRATSMMARLSAMAFLAIRAAAR